MTPRHAIALFTALSLSLAGCTGHRVETAAPANDLRFSAHSVIEAAPVHYAIRRLGAARPEVPNGAIPALYGPDGGIADLAGHADTQALKHSLVHPDLRIILTITEGHYRIIARRSAGIRSMADLRGKKVATVKDSSAAYYLYRALQTAALTERDVEIIPVPLPPRDAAQLLLNGKADALALWDPEPEIAIHELGEDVVILDPPTGYKELYNLHSTAAKLADPVTREKIVRFVAQLIRATEQMQKEPEPAIAMAAEVTAYAVTPVRNSWPLQSFPASLAPTLLETLVTEEVWLAALDGRKARGRAELAALIDPTIEQEARAWLRKNNRP